MRKSTGINKRYLRQIGWRKVFVSKALRKTNPCFYPRIHGTKEAEQPYLKVSPMSRIRAAFSVLEGPRCLSICDKTALKVNSLLTGRGLIGIIKAKETNERIKRKSKKGLIFHETISKLSSFHRIKSASGNKRLPVQP